MTSEKTFKIVFDGAPLEFGVAQAELTFFARSGSWVGQTFEDEGVGLIANVDTGESLWFNPSGVEDEGLELTPGLRTEWLKMPAGRLADRDFRRLADLDFVYRGDGSLDAISHEPWREPPGLLQVYTGEAFAIADLNFAHLGGAMFRLTAVGVTENGTSFDIAADMSATVQFWAARNSATQDEMLAFFETTFNTIDFDLSWRRSDDTLYLDGAPKDRAIG